MDHQYSSWGAPYYPPQNYQFPDFPTQNFPNFPANFSQETPETNIAPAQIQPNWSENFQNFSDFSAIPQSTSVTFGSVENFENYQKIDNFGVYEGQKLEESGGKKSGNSSFEWMKTKRQRDSSSKKPTTFSRYQQMELEKEYLVMNYLKPTMKTAIAKRLGITENQVKTWYQNRRQKEKRVQKEKNRYSNGSSTTEGTRSSTTPELN